MRVIRLDNELICFGILSFVFISRECVFDFGSERVIGFVLHHFRFTDTICIAVDRFGTRDFISHFSVGFMGDSFHVSLRWVFGDLILIYAGSNFLDSGMSVSCFLHSLQGVWELQLVVRVIFHLPDGMPL